MTVRRNIFSKVRNRAPTVKEGANAIQVLRHLKDKVHSSWVNPHFAFVSALGANLPSSGVVSDEPWLWEPWVVVKVVV